MKKRSVVRLAAMLAAVTMTAAACSSDSSSDAVDTTTAATEPSADTTTPAETTTPSETTGASTIDRTGETIKVGYVNNEGGAFSLPEFRIGGEVAIDEINKDGGINGATIEVVGCLADASPEGSINCANQLIEAGVVLAYTGIDVASDAALPLYQEAGIPYVTSNGWGAAQGNADGSHILHAASDAYSVGPFALAADLNITKVANVSEQTPAGESFVNEITKPIAETLGIELQTITVDPAAPDWAAAVATAQSSGAEMIWGQLTEPGCIGMVGAARAAAFEGEVFAGSCSFYIPAVGDAAVGTYTQGDLYFPSMKSFAPERIAQNLTDYEAAMEAAGQADYIEGFAAAAYGAWMELRAILERVEGDMTAETVEAELNSGEVTPGWFGPDIKCGAAPWPTSKSSCSASIAVYEVVKNDDGTVGRAVAKDFFDAYEYSQG
ncbi:MAG: ABC transporter substrate-binding protein [Ilumatobacteraceae bacterium]